MMAEIRNPVTPAELPAAAWHETHLAPSGDGFATFEALAPAIARLSRSRPLTLHRRADDLPRPAGALEIVLPAGDIEAVILVEAMADTTATDRIRLEKELAAAEGHL